MEVEIAVEKARELARHYGLTALSWTVVLSSNRRRAGYCNFWYRHIGLSQPIIEINDEPVIMDVVIHEIAHALIGKEGHGEEWREKAIELGGSGRVRPIVKLPVGPWSLRCVQRHGIIGYRYRRSSAGHKLWCRECRKDGWHSDVVVERTEIAVRIVASAASGGYPTGAAAGERR